MKNRSASSTLAYRRNLSRPSTVPSSASRAGLTMSTMRRVRTACHNAAGGPDGVMSAETRTPGSRTRRRTLRGGLAGLPLCSHCLELGVRHLHGLVGRERVGFVPRPDLVDDAGFDRHEVTAKGVLDHLVLGGAGALGFLPSR